MGLGPGALGSGSGRSDVPPLLCQPILLVFRKQDPHDVSQGRSQLVNQIFYAKGATGDGHAVMGPCEDTNKM